MILSATVTDSLSSYRANVTLFIEKNATRVFGFDIE